MRQNRGRLAEQAAHVLGHNQGVTGKNAHANHAHDGDERDGDERGGDERGGAYRSNEYGPDRWLDMGA